MIIRASAALALVLSAATLANAMDEQHVAVPAAGSASGAAAAAQPAVQPAAPAAKEPGTEIRIPGLGKLGTLPKMDFGLELLYGANETKPAQEALPGDKDNQDLMIRGSVKHNF